MRDYLAPVRAPSLSILSDRTSPDELILVASASLASHSQVLKESKFKEHGRITPGACASRTFKSKREPEGQT